MTWRRLLPTLVRLKVALLLGGLRLGVWQAVGTVAAWVFAAAASVLVLLAGAALRTVDAGDAAQGVVLAGAALTFGWAAVPVLAAGVDETLDPARFALLPVPARRLAPALLVASVVGAPGLVALAAATAAVLVWSRGPAAVVVAVLAAPVAVLTCVLASRLSTTLAARVLGGRRAREATGVVAIFVVSLLGLLPASMVALANAGLDVRGLAVVLGWTPLGLAWAAPAAVAQGDTAGGAARLVLAVAVLAAGAAAWTPLLARQLRTPASGGGGGRVVRRSVMDRVPASPAWAVAARRLTAWRRDPRYVAALGGAVLVGVLPVVLSLVGAVQVEGDVPGGGLLLAVGPLVGLLLGVSSGNDAGYDGSAFAAHLVTGVSGAADRAGRAAAMLVVAVPLVLVASAVACVLADRADVLPGVAGVGLALVLGGTGAGSVAGALAAYPMAEAGANPFRSNSGASGRALLGQLLMTGVTMAGAAPALALAVAGSLVHPVFGWAGLVTGTVVGAGVLVAGVVLGGLVVDARGPELLASVRRTT